MKCQGVVCAWPGVAVEVYVLEALKDRLFFNLWNGLEGSRVLRSTFE